MDNRRKPLLLLLDSGMVKGEREIEEKNAY